MIYRVTFMERTNKGGQPSEKPEEYLELEAPDGVIVDQTFVERTEPLATHVEDQLDEDDSFLSVGSETWDYDVADDREDEFIASLKNCGMAMEWHRLDGGPGLE